MIERGKKKSCVDASQGALIFEYVGDNDAVLVKVFQGRICHEDHFREDVLEHQHGPVDQPFALKLEEGLVNPHPRAFPP